MSIGSLVLCCKLLLVKNKFDKYLLFLLETQRADQRKTAMYRGSNRIQIAARVNIMHPKKFGDHHRDENMDYRRDGGVQKGNCDNYLHLAIHFSGQYPRAKIFCTRMFYFPVTH